MQFGWDWTRKSDSEQSIVTSDPELTMFSHKLFRPSNDVNSNNHAAGVSSARGEGGRGDAYSSLTLQLKSVFNVAIQWNRTLQERDNLPTKDTPPGPFTMALIRF